MELASAGSSPYTLFRSYISSSELKDTFALCFLSSLSRLSPSLSAILALLLPKGGPSVLPSFRAQFSSPLFLPRSLLACPAGACMFAVGHGGIHAASTTQQTPPRTLPPEACSSVSRFGRRCWNSHRPSRLHYGRASQPPAHPSVDPNSVACRRRAPFFLHRVYRSSSPGFYLSLSLPLFRRASERAPSVGPVSFSVFSLSAPSLFASLLFLFLSLLAEVSPRYSRSPPRPPPAAAAVHAGQG